MSAPYVQHQNIYFVPILRQRLNFAILVRRAVEHLQLDKGDCIAVELPKSVGNSKAMETALIKLPQVFLVIASLRGGEQREVFPMTPCDGIVEALRIAPKKALPLHYIDQDIAPGLLMDRHCTSDPDWPDDTLALERGAAWYLELIQDRLSRPPARLEPVDTWRETFMAEQLRRLHFRYQRILCVCDATHVQPIRERLRQARRVPAGTETAVSTLDLDVQAPSLPILLRYLDDIPRLVEIYEQYRETRKAQDFNKRSALLEVVHQQIRAAPDLQFAIRHSQAFTHLLANLMALQQRMSPTLDDVLAVSASCFGPPFTERLRCHLVGYRVGDREQVSVTRVGRLLPPGEDLYGLWDNREDATRVFVTRSCSPIQHRYAIIAIRNSRRRASETLWHSWPPQDQWTDRMQHKARLLSKRGELRITTSKFQGAINAGIDVRRTLRSYLKPTPELYVKSRLSTKVKEVESHAPVVWLFEIEPKKPAYRLRYMWIGRRSGPQYASSWYYGTEAIRLATPDAEELEVWYEELMGRVSFCELRGATLEGLQQRYGEELEKRLPKVEKLAELTKQLPPECPWWQLLLVGALESAQESVVCVAPEGFVLPEEIVAQAASQGKTLHHVPLARFFSEDEQRNLRRTYRVVSRVQPSDDIQDAQFISSLVVSHESALVRFWPKDDPALGV